MLLGAAVLGGCAPRLSPVYRDYALPASLAAPGLAESARADSLRARAAAALRAAGWTVQPRTGALPAAVQTERRTVSSALVYRNQVAVFAFPVGERLLRVQFQPVRRYTARTRTFLPYLPASLAREVVPGLDAALRARGFAPVLSGPRKDQGAR